VKKEPIAQKRDDFLSRVSLIITTELENTLSSLGGVVDIRQLAYGKMLRTRFASQLLAANSGTVNQSTVELACAAIEITHTASLCHDDVVDNGLIRRGAPALWKSTSRSGAILVGDLLLCKAMDLVLEIPDKNYVRAFMSKVAEVVSSEAEQELILRGKQTDERTCLRLARGKTGPLFAYVGFVCGGKDMELSSAIEEVGYRVGTAYQLADDLIDLSGREDITGKTLGTDLKRKKFTLPQKDPSILSRNICDLLLSALEILKPWPTVRSAVNSFLETDITPIFDKFDSNLDICERLAI